jgi:DNA-binding NtrC family response regulator
VAPVELPGFADRPADRGPLAEALLPALADRIGTGGTVLEAEARQVVAAHDWPGNLPEMRAVLMAALIETEPGRAVTPAALRRAIARIGRPALPPPAPGGFAGWLDGALAGGGIALEEIERQIYDAAVARTDGNLSAAARLLGISRAQLSYRLTAKRDPA